MEQDKKAFVHDTIDLDEIRDLLDRENEALYDDTVIGAAVEPVKDFFMSALAADELLTDDAEPVAESPAEESSDDDLYGFFSDDDPFMEAAAVQSPADDVEVVKEPKEESLPKEKRKKKERRGFLHELYNMLHDVIYLLTAVTLIFVFAVRLVGVQGDSMYPTLQDQDYLVLESNFLIGEDELEYGDVVVLKPPHYAQEGPIVKRVIATEGQTVDIDFEAGYVYVDGVQLMEDYVNTPTNINWNGELGLDYPVVVPENHIFVLGDNRNDSMDSRYADIGMVDEQYVLGKVLLIVLPGQTTDDIGNVTDPRDWGRIGLVS